MDWTQLGIIANAILIVALAYSGYRQAKIVTGILEVLAKQNETLRRRG